MPSNPIGFRITDSTSGWDSTDFDDVFVRKDCFLEGGLWLWGNGVAGRFGNNSTISQSSPVQTISGGTNWRQVSLGESHTAAIKTDGTLWLWGGGGLGRLGTNSTVNQSSPVQTVSGGTNWKQVSANVFLTAAIKTDGTLWLWGCGNSGILGNNSTASQSSPVQTVSGGTNWRQVSAGGLHSAAIKTDGTLWIWGYGGSGQLGNNSVTNRSSPVQTISGGTNWKQVSSSNHTAAIKTDGTLWTWGNGSSGQLGDNSVTNRSSPVQTISGGTNWKQVSAGVVHTAAIKTDGTLWIWGNGSSGQLGDNTATNKSSPVQTISGGTNWKQVSSSNHTAAIKTDGTLWTWGNGSSGQLGDNTATNKSSPVQTISGGTSWRSVVAGFNITAAIREDCW